ncbi:MAG: glucosyltransferase domain-containing protein [Alphaproteobacteria bacterium]|nr:glucosyltransferase domain-containing protein [Alphaproteobacteria bacterium]
MKQAPETSFIWQCWYKTYVLVLLSFLPFLFYFLWGNHDWSWVKNETPLWSGVFEGRFSQFFLPVLLYNGKILPIFSTATGLALYTFAAVLLFNLWNIPHKQGLIILLGLNLISAPYTLSWLYFAFITLSCLSWPCVIVCAFYILQKKVLPHWASLLLSTALLIIALGGYPPVINMIGVIFFTLVLNDLCHNKLSLKSLLNKYISPIIVITVSIILLLTIHHILKLYNLQYTTYNTAGINLLNIPQKLIFCLKESLYQFVFSTSFISWKYKYIMLFFFVLAILSLYIELPKRPLHITAFILILIGLLISSVLTTLIAENTAYVLHEPRVEFYSLPYIYIFSALILLRSPYRFIKNLTVLLLLILSIYNLNTNANAAKVWQNGFKAETAFAERFLKRLEIMPSFSPQTKKYTFIQGGNLNFRSRYYLPSAETRIDSYTLKAPYIPWHLPYKAYTFYYPETFIDNDFDTYWTLITPNNLSLTPEVVEYISDKAVPWPHAKAIYMSDKDIILTLTSEGKGLAQSWLNKNMY